MSSKYLFVYDEYREEILATRDRAEMTDANFPIKLEYEGEYFVLTYKDKTFEIPNEHVFNLVPLYLAMNQAGRDAGSGTMFGKMEIFRAEKVGEMG